MRRPDEARDVKPPSPQSDATANQARNQSNFERSSHVSPFVGRTLIRECHSGSSVPRLIACTITFYGLARPTRSGYNRGFTSHEDSMRIYRLLPFMLLVL